VHVYQDDLCYRDSESESKIGRVRTSGYRDSG